MKSEFTPEVTKQLEAVSFSSSNMGFLWAPSGGALYLDGISHGVRNLWKVAVDPKTLRWVASERLTTGPGPDTDIALSPEGKKLAFTARTESTRLWSFPFDAKRGKVKGGGQPVTAAGMDAWDPDLSRDGRKMVFTGERAGKWELWEESLADGGETLLAADNFERSCRWSPEGTRLACERLNPTKNEFQYVLLPAGGGNEQALTSTSPGTLGGLDDWSPDGKWIIGSQESPSGGAGIWLLPLSAAPHAETKARLAASDPAYNLWEPHFSPDSRWIAFQAVRAIGATDSTIYVMPASGGQWTRITEGKYWDDKPRWSPDGKTIYFISARTGFLNAWAIRFDPVKGQPLGEPFRVTAFESPGHMVPDRLGVLGMSLAANRLVLPIAEVSGGIWMLEDMDR